MEPLMQLVGDDLSKVNHAILDRMDSRAPLIPQLAGHIIASGGKRLRPMLTLACTRLCGYVGERQIGLAAAVEFIHTASLLHDDVVDESDLRRGDATANVLWGNQPSVLVGDFLFSRAFQIMVADGSLEVLRVLANASAVIAEGEVMQLETMNNVEIPEEKYLEVISAKTAALFAAACRIGAVIAGRGGVEEDALESFGRNLGIAFQLIDDTLDYSAQQATFGKTVGDDFREGKVTLPVLLAFRRGDDEERAFWRRCIGDGKQEDGDLDQAVTYLHHHDALRDAIERARHYGAMARDGLGIFPDGEAKRALIDVVDFCIERAY
ncbi:MAG: polyprenyl synthetase family protein [Alphaproteobacteria bacterium]|jgi:octaprenyl-diphosphate synthase